MAKIPCIPQARIFTLKDTGETMSYDQVREYLMSNPELWSGKGEQKAGPLSSVEATAKALEGMSESKVKKLAALIFPNTKADKIAFRSQNEKGLKAHVGTYFSYDKKYAEVYGRAYGVEAKPFMLDIKNPKTLYIPHKESKKSGENTIDGRTIRFDSITKDDIEFLKSKGYDGVIVVQEEFPSLGIKETIGQEVVVFDKRQVKSFDSISEAYHAAKKDGTNLELVKAVEDLLGGEQKAEGKKADPVLEFLEKGKIKGVTGMNAALWNRAIDIIQAAYRAGKTVYEAMQAGIDYLESKGEDIAKYQKRIDDTTNGLVEIAKKQGKPIGMPAKKAAQKPTEEAPKTKKKEEAPEENKPVRELPEAPEGQVAKAVLGRSYQATTSEKVAEAMEKSGLFREVRNLDEAFKAGRKFVDELGWDGAYELFQDLTATVDGGILLPEDNRMGIFNALTEDLQKRIDNPVSLEQQSKDAILMAEVMAKGSELVSRGAYRMRVFQEILRRNTVPYQYEKRIKEWKALFPDSEITKELEDKLKAAEAKYILINQKYMDLIAKQKEQEESEAVSDIKQDIEIEKKAAKKPITSALKTLAAKVRKLGLSRPGMFSAASPASLAWDAAVEVVAVTLEAGGSIEIAIKKGLQSIVDSKWYKGLSDKDKKRAESEFVNHHADLEEAGAGMAEVVKSNISIPHSLIRYYVSEGMTDIDEIAETIREGLSEEYPDITKREVRDAITGYARKVKKRTPDEINDAINTLKSEGRLRSQLEDLQEGIKKEKDPKRKKELSELAKNLMKEIDKIHQDMFGHTTKQMSDAERLEAYKKRAAERIKELRRKIDQKDFAKKEKRPPVDFDKEASDLELEQYLLDEEWADMVREQELKNQGTLTKIGDLLLNVWGIPRSVVVGIDYGVFAIQAGLSTFNSRKQTAKAFASAFKAMKSVSNYQRVDAALKANPKYLDAKKAGLKFYSPKDPDIMKGDMISVSALQRAWNAIGEGFLKLVSPVIGSGKEKQWYDTWKKINPIAGLERSQAAFINTLNFGLYLRGAEIARERGYVFNKANEQIFKDIADVTNTLSRKAALGGLENNKKFMTAMSASFFSAQNWAALLKLASPYTFVWLGSKRAGTTKWNQLSPAQQVYGEIFVKAVGTYLSTLLLVKLMTGWEDDDMDDEERKKKGAITVNMTDPRRSDYLKVRLPEGTIDPFSGLAQEVILSYRIWKEIIGERGFVSSKTGIETYLGEGTTPSWAGLIGRQAEGKLSPSARYLWRRGMSKQIKGQPDYIRKMILTGEEINMKEEAIDLFTNLTYETALDQYKDYNVLPATFLSLLAFAGYGFTREERAEDKAISKQIKETLGPEKKYLAYEKALKSYLKEGNEELAKKVFKNALQGQSEGKKSIEMFKELGQDNIPQKYNLESKDFDELLSVAKTGRPIDASEMSEVKAKRMREINSLNKESLDRIKSDYGVQYEELQSAARVLKSLNIKNSEGEPINWDYKMSTIPWVKKYRRIVLGAE